MYKPRNGAEWGVAAAAVLVLFGITAAWVGYGGPDPYAAKDYEDCAAKAKADASSEIDYNKLIIGCSESRWRVRLLRFHAKQDFRYRRAQPDRR
jgi:hypothetical protein